MVPPSRFHDELSFFPAKFIYDVEKMQRQEQIYVDSINRHDYYCKVSKEFQSVKPVFIRATVVASDAKVQAYGNHSNQGGTP